MDINHPRIQKIIRDLAEQHHVPPDAVRRIVISQFECVVAYMKKVDADNNYFPYIKLPYLFTFRVKEYRKKSLIELNQKRKENVHTQGGEDNS